MEYLKKYFNYENFSITYGLTNELICFYVLNLLSKTTKNIIIVTSTLFEANKLYNSLSTYSNDVLLFPMDDFITSVAISISPEFKLSRIEVLNQLKSGKRKIIIANLNGYLKYLPDVNELTSLNLEVEKTIKKSELVEKLNLLGYKKESLVTCSGEYASRGMIVDIFPLNEEHPVRIEYLGNKIDKIKYFDEETQLSSNSIDKIIINAIDEIKTINNSSLYDYSDKGIVLFINKEQIDLSYKKIYEEITDYNRINNENKKYMFELDEINPKQCLFIDNINRTDNLEIKEMINFNE